MNALDFTPSKVTVNMDPVDLSSADLSSADIEPASGERRILWMVRTDDGQVGPVSVDLIVRGINLGKVPETAEVAPVDSDTWRPVLSIVPNDTDAGGDDDAARDSVVAAKVVPVGQPEFEWPASFAPGSASTPPPAPQMPQPMAQQLMQQQVMQQSVAPQPMMQSPMMQQPAVQPAMMQQSSFPNQQPSFQGEEPITIPTQGVSPAVIAFGATLAVSAVIGIGVAIIQAL